MGWSSRGQSRSIFSVLYPFNSQYDNGCHSDSWESFLICRTSCTMVFLSNALLCPKLSRFSEALRRSTAASLKNCTRCCSPKSFCTLMPLRASDACVAWHALQTYRNSTRYPSRHIMSATSRPSVLHLAQVANAGTGCGAASVASVGAWLSDATSVSPDATVGTPVGCPLSAALAAATVESISASTSAIMAASHGAGVAMAVK